jgi:hypothetical protein
VAPAIAPVISIRAICLRNLGLKGQIMGNYSLAMVYLSSFLGR